MSETALETTTTEVVDRKTGEIVDIATCEFDQLATLRANMDDVKAEIADATAPVDAEILRRLDKSARWTRRVRHPEIDADIEITAPSPKAGDTTIDVAVLEKALADLLERDVIAAEAVDGALARTITIRARVPVGADIDEMKEAVDAAASIAIAGVTVVIEDVAVVRKASKAGLGALTKIGGEAADAVVSATVDVPAPARKPKVKIKTKT